MILWGVFLLVLLAAFVLYACFYASGDDQPNEENDNFNDWEIF